MTLSAANTSPIHVYTTQTLSLDFGLRRVFKWTFLVGNVSTPIIGADFLYHFNLIPDIARQTLLDSSTSLHSHCMLGNTKIHSVKTVSGDSIYHQLLREFPNITKPPRPDQEIKHSVVHHIQTTGPPVTAKARRLAPDRLRIAKAEFQNMIELGHMRPSKSNYASPLHMVPKKDSTEWRPVGDYRALNAQTIKDNYTVPNILDFTAELHGTQIYSRIDLVKAYHQIPINPDDIHKSAIITPFGLFESLRMQFGLCNAAATFQRFIDEVMRGLSFVFKFVDDMLIASRSPEEHLEHLRIVFERLNMYGLSIKPSKCIFGVSEIDFLGFNVSESGIKPLADRVNCIQKFPIPQTITQLKRFLGLYNFYRRFVPKAAHLLAPLNKFLEGIKYSKKSKKSNKNACDSIQWTVEAEQAFTNAKEALANATLLKHPIPGAQLSLWIDASNVAVGGSLMQLNQKNWEPVAFLSVKLSQSQQKWSTYDRELFAMYTGVKRFRHMLEGRKFIIYTDQKPLIYAFKQNPEKCSPRQWRHLDFISQFSTDVRHVKGNENLVADALSRIEIDQITNSPFLNFENFAQEQKDDMELQELQKNNTSSLELKIMPSPISSVELLCDISTGNPRPIVPGNLRRAIFEHFHNLAHPGVAASLHLLSSRYVWPKMRKQINEWVKSCQACQRSKIQRHTKTPLGTFALPDARFSHLHIDLIGPLPPSEGKVYCLTILDRYTRWPEVVPITEITAEAVCRALFNGWISRFGCPATITTDQGRQFESALFKEMISMLGTNRIRTTSFHPIANGFVERFHRVLKSALKAHENPRWTETLPTVLLGLRAAVKPDLKASSAELVYGVSLRLPAELCSTTSSTQIPNHNFVKKLKEQMNQLNPCPTSAHGHSKIFMHPELQKCTHVFLRVDKISPPLSQPYTGPHEVVSRTDKHITININERKACVSMDRVKPAFIFKDLTNDNKQLPVLNPTATCPSKISRSGRHVKFPKRLITEIP